MKLPIASRGPSVRFCCPNCGKFELRRQDTRPSSLGEDRGVQSRLYACLGCGLTVLTEEHVVGMYSKRSLPKSNAPVEGESVVSEAAGEGQTGTR